VLQSKCLRRVAGAPWYLNNRQIHEDLGVPLFADHVRTLTASFASNLIDAGDTLFRQLGRYSDRGLALSLEVQTESNGRQQTSRGHR
jgi:hypothetical protein